MEMEKNDVRSGLAAVGSTIFVVIVAYFYSVSSVFASFYFRLLHPCLAFAFVSPCRLSFDCMGEHYCRVRSL